MNNVMEYKGYYGTVEYSATDKVLHGKVIGIKSLLSYEGDNVQNLEEDFQECVDDYLEFCTEKGFEPEKAYKGSFNIRIEPALHRQLSVYSVSNGMSLNSTVEKAIREYIN
jgi:predicted HicB family RNase H-like nuclease